MNMGIWLLLCFTPTVLAVEEVLLDTQLEQDELNWLVTPEGGWEETVAVDKLFNTMRTYRVCNVDRPNQDNWLRSAYIARREAQMVYIDLRFTIRDCSSIPGTDGSCRETFALHYGEADSDSVPSASIAAHLKATYTKARDITAEHVFALNGMGKVNRATVPIGPLTGAGFYLAFRDRGACINLLSVRASFRKCPATITNLARFPETAAGPGLSSLAVSPGTCVANAVETSVPVKLHCASDGDWVVPVGGCGCRPGYRSNEELTTCTESEEQAIVFELGSEQRPSQHALAPSCGHLERLLRANQRQLEEQAQAMSHLTQAVEALNSTLLGISHRLHLLLSDPPDTLPDRAIAPNVNGGDEN